VVSKDTEGAVMETISVIVPVYNISSYLCRCVDSLLGQSYANLEIILVDDGSTDDCPKICDEYKRRDSRIKVLHKENGGLVSARKAGLHAATGRYVGYVDGDDWTEPDMYGLMYQRMLEQEVDVVMCGRYEDTGTVRRAVYHGIPEGRYDKEGLMESVYPRMIVNKEFFEWGIFPGVWDKLFRRECLEEFQFAVDERLTMGEDAACTYPCLLNAGSIYILHDCLYHYRQSAGSMVRRCDSTGVERKRFRALYQSVLESLDRYKNIYDLRQQWREYMLFLMVPRADVLYRDMEKMDYLFPFPNVKRGSDIIIYGMGLYGQRLYRFVRATGFCNIVVAVDRNFIELQKQGLEVASPDDIEKYEYDFIVIASSFAKARSSIYHDLTDKYSASKIYMMDEDLVKSERVLKAFGLV